MRKLDKFNDSFLGFFSNNYISGIDFSVVEPIVYQRSDGAIVANMDGVGITTKERLEQLEKAEAELAAARPLLEAAKATDTLTLDMALSRVVAWVHGFTGIQDAARIRDLLRAALAFREKAEKAGEKGEGK